MFTEGTKRSPTLQPNDSKRKMSMTMAMEIDLYDKVLYFSPSSMAWVPAVIVSINHNGTYELQLTQDSSVVNFVPATSVRRTGEPGEDLMIQRQLGASFAAEALDEDCFQLETALFTSKVLKRLETTDDSRSPSASIRRSVMISRRSRVSSSMTSNGSIPLIDRLMEDPTFPTTAHVMRIVEAVRDRHVHCPSGFSGIVSNSGGMGTCCVDAEWSSTFASVAAVTRLLEKMLEILHVMAPQPLSHATVPPAGRFVVVGDTHGQLEDVFWIFFKHGFPSSSNVYLFNGDIADRGSHSLEIFLLLFLFKWLSPESVHVIRGNHEDDYCNLNYGFCAELRHKLGQLEGGSVHQHFLEIFYALPIAAVVDSWPGAYRSKETGLNFQLSVVSRGEKDCNISVTESTRTSPLTGVIRANGVLELSRFGEARRQLSSDGQGLIRWSSGEVWESLAPRVLILHGGIPVGEAGGSPFSGGGGNAVALSDFKYFPNRQKIPAAPKTQMEQWMYQVLWSDPRETGEQRGRGTPFYPSDTDAFTAKNNLALVIRSHQLPPGQRGFGFNHRKKLITVFSASNYCGTSQNFGAVVIFTPQSFPTLSPATLVEFWAPTMSQVRDAFARHSAAPEEVRKWFSQETEKSLAPMQIGNQAQWLQLQLKVVEYVRCLVVKHKTDLWDAFLRKDITRNFVVPHRTWIDVCAEIVGSQFPWRTLAIQLEVPEAETDQVNYRDFLDSFGATVVSDRSQLMHRWSTSMVSGFFEEFLKNDVELQSQFVLRDAPIDFANFSAVIVGSCPTISDAQIRILWTSMFLSSDRNTRMTAKVTPETFIMACGAAYRPTAELASVLRDLHLAALAHASSLYSFFFRLLQVDTNTGYLTSEDFAARLRDHSTQLGLDHEFPFFAVSSFIGGSGGRVSYLRLCAALQTSDAKTRASAAISEHACAAVYFHRTAIRIACNQLDLEKSGEISKEDLKRVLLAVNSAVSDEWRILESQVNEGLEGLEWELEEEGWVNYENFIGAFSIVDRRKMTRTSSFGWHLVKDALGQKLLPIQY